MADMLMINLLSPASFSPFEQLVRYLEETDWEIERKEGVELLHTSFTGEHCEFKCAAFITKNPEVVQFITLFPMVIEAEKLPDVCQFIARANFALKFGGFELGHEQHELRFRTSALFGNGLLDPEVLENLVNFNAITSDSYVEALAGLLYGDVPPEMAVRFAEKGGLSSKLC